MKRVEYYFDVGSPYSYIGFELIQSIAKKHQATLVWKPIVLSTVFQETGNRSPATVPAKRKYNGIDLQRWAKHLDLPFQLHPAFPINTQNTMRLLTAVLMHQPEQFQAAIQAVLHSLYVDHQPIDQVEGLLQVLTEAGCAQDQLSSWLEDAQVIAQLQQHTDEAISRGVFGAPTCFVGDEMFWGVDHFNFVEMALAAES